MPRVNVSQVVEIVNALNIVIDSTDRKIMRMGLQEDGSIFFVIQEKDTQMTHLMPRINEAVEFYNSL